MLNELANLFWSETKYREELYSLQQEFAGSSLVDLFDRFVGDDNLIDVGSIRALGSRRGTLSEADASVVIRRWDLG